MFKRILQSTSLSRLLTKPGCHREEPRGRRGDPVILNTLTGLLRHGACPEQAVHPFRQRRTRLWLATHNSSGRTVTSRRVPRNNKIGVISAIYLSILSVPFSAFAQEAGQDIRGLKPLEHFSYPLWWYIISILGLAILVAAGWFIFKKYFCQDKEIPKIFEPPLPAHKIAFADLKKLQQVDPSSSFEIEKYFHFCLSEILRNYLENRFSFPATDLTIEEIKRNLPNLTSASEKNKQEIIEVLSKNDQVKFADLSLGKEKGLDLLVKTWEIVEQTKEKEVDHEIR